MRKRIVLLLLCCLLAGCSAVPAEPASPEVPPAPAPVEAPEEPPCSLELDMVEQEDSVQEDGGTELAVYRIQIPRLTALRGDGSAIEAAETEAESRALAAAEAFNGQFADWSGGESLRELADMARAEWAWRQEEEIPWSAAFTEELACRAYETERLISVEGDYYSYTGGAHPNTVLMAWNFDRERGEFIAPEQLAEDSAAFSQAVYEEILRQIDRWAEDNGMGVEDLFWDNYQEIAAGWSSYAVSFDEAGMTVGFSPYELAAYAAGSQSFQIPYDFLAPYLGDYGRGVLGLE